MAYSSKITTAQVLTCAENTFIRFGFCSYAKVARQLGVSRQAVQQRIQTALQQKQISPETVERYRHSKTHLTERLNTSLTPENFNFIKALADQLEVPPAYVLHAAITRYRLSLLESSTSNSPTESRTDLPATDSSTQ